MKKIILVTLMLMLIPFGGCKRSEGEAKTKTKEEQKITGAINGEIELPNPPIEDDKPITIKADGAVMTLPPGTTGKLEVSTNAVYSLDSISEVITTYKLTSGSSQLILFGGVLVAVGVVLIIFGMVKIGIAAMGAGFSLVACSVLISTYPWVFLIVALIALCVGAYFIYTEYKKKKVTGESKDRMYVLEKMAALVERLPAEFQDKYFKQPLREDDKSAKVRDITREARGLAK